MESLRRRVKELEKTLAARDEELEEGQCAQTLVRSGIRTYVRMYVRTYVHALNMCVYCGFHSSAHHHLTTI